MNRFWSGVAVAAVMVSGMAPMAMAQDTTSADKSFLADAAQGSLAEINFAKLALQKSKDSNVRAFATKMIHDHEMLIREMTPISKKLGVKEPTGPSIMDKAKYDELKLESGTTFDRGYVEAMVKDHTDDLKNFDDEISKTSDAQLKAVLVKAQAVIKEHLMMIDHIAHEGGIQTPPIPGCKM